MALLIAGPSRPPRVSRDLHAAQAALAAAGGCGSAQSRDAATNAARATELTRRAWQFADVESKLTKSGHLMCQKFVNPGRTTWSDVVAADFAHACDTCPRKFPGKGSLNAHSR